MVRLDDVADCSLGKMLDRGKPRGHASVPYLRNANVQWGQIHQGDLASMELAPSEVDRYSAKAGDLLVCEGGEIGRAAVLPEGSKPIAYQKALHRVRSRGNLDLKYIRYLLESYSKTGVLFRYATGSTIKHLSQQQLKGLPVPLPIFKEQRRIVDVLEDHLSRLNAAGSYATASQQRAGMLAPARFGELLRSVNGATRRLDECLSLSIGGLWGQPSSEDEEEVDVLRVTELRSGGWLDPSTAARRSVTAKQLASRRLLEGDLLLEKSGGGPRQPVGRVGIVRGLARPSICANFMQLMRPDHEIAEPRYLHLYLNDLQARGGTVHLQKASTNIRNIKASEYLQLPIAVPTISQQRVVIEHMNECLDGVDALVRAAQIAKKRSAALRSALLTAAFSGRLAGRSTDTEGVEEIADSQGAA